MREAPAHQSLHNLICLDYDRAGEIARHFFQELMRRRGRQLRAVPLPICPDRELDARSLGFSCPLRELSFGVAVPLPQPIDACEAARQAEALDREIDGNALGRTSQLPDVIHLWSLAGRAVSRFRLTEQ